MVMVMERTWALRNDNGLKRYGEVEAQTGPLLSYASRYSSLLQRPNVLRDVVQRELEDRKVARELHGRHPGLGVALQEPRLPASGAPRPAPAPARPPPWAPASPAAPARPPAPVSPVPSTPHVAAPRPVDVRDRPLEPKRNPNRNS